MAYLLCACPNTGLRGVQIQADGGGPEYSRYRPGGAYTVEYCGLWVQWRLWAGLRIGSVVLRRDLLTGLGSK